MIGAIPTERLFSLSSFEAFRLMRPYSVKHPTLNTSELISLIEKIDADGASLDIEAGAYLGTLLGPDCPEDTESFYQTCIKAVLITHQPIWAKSLRQGRQRFVEQQDKNDQNVFAAAGLMENPPSLSVVSWWDDVVGHSRLITDKEKMDQARHAERLTIEGEQERLLAEGIFKQPEWPGLDDNFAGYDVLSYNQGKFGLVNKMIEVKSTTASPLRFFVTQNEWKQAVIFGGAYVFHIWDMAKEPPILYVRTVAEIKPHIPTNNQKGAWSSVAIPLSV